MLHKSKSHTAAYRFAQLKQGTCLIRLKKSLTEPQYSWFSKTFSLLYRYFSQADIRNPLCYLLITE